jgi:F-type H+-transporting ATPase subunit alpha
MLAQPDFSPLSLAEEVALLLAVHEGRLDEVDLGLMEPFKEGLGACLDERCARARARVEQGGELAEEDRAAFLAAIDAFIAELTAVTAAAAADGDEGDDDGADGRAENGNGD